MNRLLLDVLEGKQVERPPVWLMRQAGRILPEYRKIRAEVGSFKKLVKNPSLAAEVTIQPVDALDVDAAIIFSDILVIPEAMGLDYDLVEKVGPIFPKTIESKADVDALDDGEAVLDRLDYVFDALQLTRRELGGRVPLIGFCGAPWTIFTYMLEGKGTKTFTKARKFLFQEPENAQILLEKITTASIRYLNEQVKAGAQVVQVFDSWAGVLSAAQYEELIIPHLVRIVREVTSCPVILFSKGMGSALSRLKELCDPACLGVDWTWDAEAARSDVGQDCVLQGNLDPAYLYGSDDFIREKARQMSLAFGKNHIANLGHGVYPDTDKEKVKTFIEEVKSIRYAK